MFVKNYYKFLMWRNAGLLRGKDENCFFVRTDGTNRYLDLNNSYWDITCFMYSSGNNVPRINCAATKNLNSHTIYSTTDGISGVVFGDGDTPVTINDYALSGNILSGFAWSNSTNKVFDETGFTINSLFTITNNNSDSITIKEVALYGYLSQTYSSITATSTDSYSQRFMIERTVLDAPVTIPAGGVGQVTYTIRVNYPTA